MIQYRREVDGLRAVAVLPVVLFHAGFEAFSGGFVGVDIFFVISGYLITSVILAEKEAGTFTLADFYERRARRILPALFLVMLACLPFAWTLLSPSDLERFSQSLVAVSIYGSNILFWLTSSYFEPAAEYKPLLHTWSLAVEEQYYLLFPVLLLACWRFGRRWMLALVAFIAAVSLAAAHWGSLASPVATFYLLVTRAWELLAGALAAFHLSWWRREQPPRATSEWASCIGLLLLVGPIFLFDEATPFPSLYALVPTLGTALLILFCTPETVVGRVLGHKLLVGIGLISYSAYLWNQPLFAFARHRTLGEPGALLLASLTVAVFVLAYLSWRYVETPFRDRSRVNRRQVIAYGAAASAFFIVIGLVGHFTDGVLARYQGVDRQLATMDTHEARDGLEKLTAQLSMKAFDPADSRPKVLIVGDSFAKDLINGLDAGGLLQQMQASFRAISGTCGNLFLNAAEFRDRVSRHRWQLCEREWLHDDAHLRNLMLSADEVWFASSWRGWQADYVARSVANAEALTGKPVKVFGTKNFGKVRVRVFLDMSQDERLKYQGSPDAEVLEVNRRLKAALRPELFIDVHGLLCGPEPARCKLFTPEGALITYDGGHLTRRGAEFLGTRLAASRRMNPLDRSGEVKH